MIGGAGNYGLGIPMMKVLKASPGGGSIAKRTCDESTQGLPWWRLNSKRT